MPYKVDWLIDDLVVYLVFSGVVTSDDLLQGREDCITLIESGDGLVHVVSDGTLTKKVDIGVNEIRHLAIENTASPKTGWLISVIPSPIQRFLGAIIAQFSKLRDRQFPDLESGIRFLAEGDERLPDPEEMIQRALVMRPNMVSTDEVAPD